MLSKATIQTLTVLGELIKAARKARGLSQKALAVRLNISRQTISAIERGEPSVALGSVLEAGYVLGIPLLSDDRKTLSKWQAFLSEFEAILPKKIRKKNIEVNDDF